MIYLYRCPNNPQDEPVEIHQGMMEPHTAECEFCGADMDRVYTPLIHYMPDCLWNKDGSKQDPSELPTVYSGTPRYFGGM